jgi:AcrR family transcriptional regulator
VPINRGLAQGRRNDILVAALAVVSEHGFEHATVDAVAARCGASKATLYRHWSSKESLLVDAIRHHSAVEFVVPEHGSFRADVLTALTLSAEWAHTNAALFTALVHAGHHNAELAHQTQRHIAAPHDAMWESLVARWRGGEGIRAGADLSWLGPLSEGLIFQQLLPQATLPTEDELLIFLDHVLLPLFSA